MLTAASRYHDCGSGTVVESNMIQFLTSLKRCDVTAVLISEKTDPTAYTDEHYHAHVVISMHNFLEDGGSNEGYRC